MELPEVLAAVLRSFESELREVAMGSVVGDSEPVDIRCLLRALDAAFATLYQLTEVQ